MMCKVLIFVLSLFLTRVNTNKSSIYGCYNFVGGYVLISKPNLVHSNITKISLCMRICASNEFAFDCLSLLYDRKLKKCIFSSLDRYSNSKLFRKRNNPDIILFENKCIKKKTNHSSTLNKRVKKQDFSSQIPETYGYIPSALMNPANENYETRKNKKMGYLRPSGNNAIIGSNFFDLRNCPTWNFFCFHPTNLNRKNQIVTESFTKTNPVLEANPMEIKTKTYWIRSLPIPPRPAKTNSSQFIHWRPSFTTVNKPIRPFYRINHSIHRLSAEQIRNFYDDGFQNMKQIINLPPTYVHAAGGVTDIAGNTTDKSNIYRQTDEIIEVLGGSINYTEPIDEQTNAPPTNARIYTEEVPVTSDILNCFKRTADKKLENSVEENFIADDVLNCLRKCIWNKKFHCLSANYNRRTKNCDLNGRNTLLNGDPLTDLFLVDYYENICNNIRELATVDDNHFNGNLTTKPDSQIGILNETNLYDCFELQKKTVLLDLDGIVIENFFHHQSSVPCLCACVLSRRKHRANCYAVSWYSNTKRCFIYFSNVDPNYSSSSSESDLYINTCNDNDLFKNQRQLNYNKSIRDVQCEEFN